MREDNAKDHATYVYTYDNAGNILSKKIYALTAQGVTPINPTDVYTYGYNDPDWGDLLTSYRDHTITYDAIGNPLDYYNGTNWTFTWSGGRRLATAISDTTNLSFQYNDDGIRTSKTVNDVEHVYHLNGSQIIMEEWGYSVLVYLYDAEGSPIGMQFRDGTMAVGQFHTFWFEKNLQGDIVAVYRSDGTKLISYTYDAWGNFITSYHNGYTATDPANLNPFRYRGYYYDTDLQMYYLQSRYYDPVIGRFINADDTAYLGADATLLSYNLFIYCKNNPVMGHDPTGHFSWKNVFNVAAVVTIAAIAVIAIVGSGGTAAPPLLAAACALTGTTVTAAAVTTVAAGVAITGVATMGVALTASLLESTSKENGLSKQDNKYSGKSTYNKDGERIDYEYNGNGSGNVHYQGTKGKTTIWRLQDGIQTMYTVSKAVGKIISDPKVHVAIVKAIDIVLSLAGLK